MSQQRRARAETWETVFGVAFLVIGTNAMLVVASAPLVVLLVSTDPRSSWPALSLAAIAATPAVAAAFAVFRDFSLDRGTGVTRAFWRGWVRHGRRAVALGSLVVLATVVISVDLAVLQQVSWGALVTPLLIVIGALVWATGLHALVASVERRDARLRDVLKASLFLSVRRWYLTLVSFAALGLLGALFVERPALALGIAASPLLYAAWGNSRYTLRPILPRGATVQV